MFKLKEIKVRDKLLISNVVVLLILFSYGVFAISRNAQLVDLNQTLYTHPLQVSNAANSATIQVVRIHRSMKDVVLSTSESEMLHHLIKVENDVEDFYGEFEIIHDYILGDEGMVLYQTAYDLFVAWEPIRKSVISLVEEGKTAEAAEITKSIGDEHVAKLEKALNELNVYARNKANGFFSDSNSIGDSSRTYLLYLMLLGILLAFSTTAVIYRSLLGEINHIKFNLKKRNRHDLSEIEVLGSGEIREIIKSINFLIGAIKTEIALKDDASHFNSLLDYSKSNDELNPVLVDYILSVTNVDSVLIYNINQSERKIELVQGSKYTEEFIDSFDFGQGIIGQAVNSKKSILITADKIDDYLVSGAVKIPFSSTFVTPIVHDGEVYGVIEISSINQISQNAIDFIESIKVDYGYFMNTFEQNNEIAVLLSQANEYNETILTQSARLKQNNVELVQKQSELELQKDELLKKTEIQNQLNIDLEDRKRILESQTLEMKLQNSELERIKEELLVNNEKLIASDQYKTNFLTNMSHELRTPLNSIILLSQILSRNNNENLSANDIKKTEIINKAGKELLSLINDILDLSKIESGKVDLVVNKFSMQKFLDSLGESFSDLAQEKNLKFEIVNDVEAPISSDEEKLLHIATNLLSNAFKFTTEGSVKLEARSSELDEYQYKVSVIDTGIGVSKEKQSTIFEEFVQEDGSISRRFGGTGLGLSICTSLAKLVQGEIKLTSKEGEGSTFSVHFNDYDFDIEDEKTNVVNQLISIDDDSLDEGNAKNILLIEDDLELSKNVKARLNERGYNMIHSSLGKDGIEKASQYNLEAIILDLILPDTSGEEVLHNLKTSLNTRKIPVYIFSRKNKDELRHLYNFGVQKIKMKQKDPKTQIDGIIDDIEKLSKNEFNKILLVEDNEADQIYLKEVLTGSNYNLDLAENKNQAIDLINNNSYNAIIVDLYLRDESGIEICEFIKEKEIMVPVIVHTAKDLNEEESRELSRISDSIILKTVNSKGRLLEVLSIFASGVNRSESTMDFNDQGLKGKRILICDDDVKNIFSLSSALEEMGIDVVETFNGREAVDILKKDSNFDLILMDIMMPVMDGVTAIKLIKADKLTKDIPIITLTAKAMKGDKNSFIKAGASDYLSKPIDLNILNKLLKVWMVR